jgi:excisionase family DNA binding protein
MVLHGTNQELHADSSRPEPTATPLGSGSPWLTPPMAAAYLGIALGTLRNWTSARFVPHSKKGRFVRYHRDALDRWMSRGNCPGRATFAARVPRRPNSPKDFGGAI